MERIGNTNKEIQEPKISKSNVDFKNKHVFQLTDTKISTKQVDQGFFCPERLILLVAYGLNFKILLNRN